MTAYIPAAAGGSATSCTNAPRDRTVKHGTPSICSVVATP